jgi:hypothetical protein
MLNGLKSYRFSALILSLIATALVTASVFVWWNFIYQSPRNVFWGAMENNLQTSSVIKHVSVTQNGQGLDQYIRLQLGSTNAAQWLVTLKQANSNVVTESIGTPTTGYVRYVKANTSQKRADGSTYDFSKVINVWAKADDNSKQTLKRLFSQTVLDIGTVPTPPIANLPKDQRDNLLQFMNDQKVFAPDFNTMKRKTIDGREVYVYDVQVNLSAYLRMMQAFARNIGLKDLESADPAQFQTEAPVKLRLTIDAAGRYLRELSYPEQDYKQEYSGYGIVNPIAIPDKTISVTELQTRLQSL